MNETHFQPLRLLRSLRAKFNHFIGYSAASISSVLVDYVVFSAVIFFGGSALAALILGRVCSFTYNYAVLHTFVNRGSSAVQRSLPRYFLLTVFSTSVAYFIMSYVRSQSGLPIILVKVIIESLLFFFNYFASRFWVFRYN